MTWQIDGAMALWIGYWIFMIVVVWRYEKRNRELENEVLKLRKLLAKRGVLLSSVGDSGASSGESSRVFSEAKTSGKPASKSSQKGRQKPSINRQNL